MWTKKNDLAPKSECADFLKNMCPKNNNFGEEKNSSLSILMSFLSSLLVRCVEDVACKSCYNNSYKHNERFHMYVFNVSYA